MLYRYLEVFSDECVLYTTSSPTKAPCHEEGVERRRISCRSPASVAESLKGHATLLHKGQHTAYEVDEYSVNVLSAFEWFLKSEAQDWMPRECRNAVRPFSLDHVKLLSIRESYDSAAAEVETIQPQEEWGFFSDRLTTALRDEFLRRRLKGQNIHAAQFFEAACKSVRNAFKRGPELRLLYGDGYCEIGGKLFLTDGTDVILFSAGENMLRANRTNGTTASVREAIRTIGKGNDYYNLRTYHENHTEVFDNLKRRNPDLYQKVSVAILFRD